VNVQFDPSQATSGVAAPHRQHHRGHDLSGLAKSLGVSVDDLREARRSGQSLSDFATSKGISRDDLLTAVEDDIKAHKPDGAPELSDDQLTAFATRIIDATPGRRPEMGGRQTQMPSASVLDALQQVKTPDGSSLADVLSKLSVTGSDGGSTTGLDEVLKLLQSNTYGADGSSGLGTSLGVDAAA
jgi:hypothetical protein